MLMIFMARVHTRAAVLHSYLPRLLGLAQRIGQGADHQGQDNGQAMGSAAGDA